MRKIFLTIFLTLVFVTVSYAIPKGFRYINEANYLLLNLDKNPHNYSYLYSDSATSCVIVAVVGKNREQQQLVAFAHLVQPQGIGEFFNKVVAPNFVGPVKIYAQGANPPTNVLAEQNARSLLFWIYSGINVKNQPWYISSVDISLLQGNPNKFNRSSYGIDLQTLRVSNKVFDLTMKQRDPTGGAMILYAMFSRRISPPIWLRNAETPLSHELMDKIIAHATKIDFFKGVGSLTAAEIKQRFSTTPSIETPSFVPVIRQAYKYYLEHK